MNDALTALFVKQFYKLNSGFFLFCFLIFFGIVNFHDMVYFHYSLMERTHETKIMLLLFSAWLLYGIKCLNFGLQELGKPSNAFLYQLQELPGLKQLKTFFRLEALIYLPALVYAVFTFVVLLSKDKVVPALLILIFQFVLLFVLSIMQVAKLNSTYKSSRLSEFLGKFNYTGKTNYHYWLIQYLAATKKRTLLGIKIGSLILLQALVTYNKLHLNFESVAFLMMGLVLAHSVVPYYIREFAEERLTFMRALPLSMVRRFLWFTLSFGVLLIPELIFLLFHLGNAIPLSLILSIYLLSVALLCVFYSLLYLPGIKIEQYMLIVTVVFFVMIMSLASVPIWWLAGIIFLISVILFRIYYERWEAKL